MTVEYTFDLEPRTPASAPPSPDKSDGHSEATAGREVTIAFEGIVIASLLIGPASSFKNYEECKKASLREYNAETK